MPQVSPGISPGEAPKHRDARAGSIVGLRATVPLTACPDAVPTVCEEPPSDSAIRQAETSAAASAARLSSRLPRRPARLKASVPICPAR